MQNKEILEKLFETANNGTNVSEYLGEWDTSQPFPMAEVRCYIRLNEWTKDDYDTHVELIIKRILPEWFYKVYLCMQEFIYTPYAELSSSQEVFAKLMGYPIKSLREKAFCVYNYALQYYIKGENNETK